MGVYQVGKLLFEVSRNPQVAEEFKANPETVMERYRLSEEEKAAVRDKDIRYFYQLGINPYQLTTTGRLFGLQQREWLEALADAGPSPVYPSVSFPGRPKEGQYLIRSGRR